MKYDIELGGKFEAEINYWSGKTSLSFEGEELPRGEKKNTFLLGEETCRIAGSLFAGVYLFRGDEKVLVSKLFWYDYVICLIPFIVSLIGGLIGAALGIASFFLCYKIMPYVKSFFFRFLICLAIAAALFLIILFLAALFPSLFFD